jgi:hypothetical protein
MTGFVTRAGGLPRIKLAVAGATPADLAPELLIAMRRFVPAIGARPFLIVIGRNDEMCEPDEAERVFHAIGSPRAELSSYEGMHKSAQPLSLRRSVG